MKQATVRRFKYHNETAVNRKWVKRLSSNGKKSVLKWYYTPWKGGTLVRYIREKGYTNDDIHSIWLDAILDEHLRDYKGKVPLEKRIIYKFHQLLKVELKFLIQSRNQDVNSHRAGNR